jgi:hypothetical protein
LVNGEDDRAILSTTAQEDDKMAMELELGVLIYALNPYADTMHLSADMPPEDPKEIQGILQGREAEAQIKNALVNTRGISMEMETRQSEYLSWQFKDLPRLVKRAVRLEYRHLYKKTGVWVTDHLLIGYEGSNGG